MLSQNLGAVPVQRIEQSPADQRLCENVIEARLGGQVERAGYTLVPLNLCSETLDGIRNHSWSRPAPGTPEGEVVSWADRIAYVCHDFEDAVRAGILVPDDLPAEVAAVVGSERSAQIGVFLGAVLEAIARTGRVDGRHRRRRHVNRPVSVDVADDEGHSLLAARNEDRGGVESVK